MTTRKLINTTVPELKIIVTTMKLYNGTISTSLGRWKSKRLGVTISEPLASLPINLITSQSRATKKEMSRVHENNLQAIKSYYVCEAIEN